MDDNIHTLKKSIFTLTYGSYHIDQHDLKNTRLATHRPFCNNFVLKSVISNNQICPCRKADVWHIKILHILCWILIIYSEQLKLAFNKFKVFLISFWQIFLEPWCFLNPSIYVVSIISYLVCAYVVLMIFKIILGEMNRYLFWYSLWKWTKRFITFGGLYYNSLIKVIVGSHWKNPLMPCPQSNNCQKLDSPCPKLISVLRQVQIIVQLENPDLIAVGFGGWLTVLKNYCPTLNMTIFALL